MAWHPNSISSSYSDDPHDNRSDVSEVFSSQIILVPIHNDLGESIVKQV